MHIIGKEEKMREIEKNLDKRIWSHESRERWSLKGCGLINF
jgi:hypothetical protein